MLDKLVESLESCPIVKRGEYNYFIHPITDGVPEVEPALLREVCTGMIKVLDLGGVDRIVAAEAMGIHIGSVLSCATDIPMNIVRKRVYRLPGEIAVHQATGYSKGELYLNGVHPGTGSSSWTMLSAPGGPPGRSSGPWTRPARRLWISALPSGGGTPISGGPTRRW